MKNFELIDMECPACGDTMNRISETETMHVEKYGSKGFAFYSSSESIEPSSIKCPSCGREITVWNQGDETIRRNTIIIKGNISGNNIVIGNNNVVN